MDTFGIVPTGVELGDVVCVFAGAETVFILRPVQVDDDARTVYPVVGDYYVHGLMKGEVFNIAGLEKRGFELV